jgi:glutaminyl-peptide cyclotransferase
LSSDRRLVLPAVAVVALILAVLAPVKAPGAAAEEADTFSGARAMHWVHAQCDLGPRPPGSDALERLRRLIEAHADSLGLPVARMCFQADDPWNGGQVELCNLVVSVGPAGGDRLWLGAHYDTRPAADRDPDPERRDEPLLGANDGGSGTAVLLHLMELLAADPPPRGVDLIFFDGEDSGHGGQTGGFCLGSKRLAATWDDFGSPLASGRPRAMVLLDMVGRRGLRIGMEGYSLRWAPDLTRAVFDRAAELKLPAFVPSPAQPVYDDHVPLLQAGIPSVDLIDFNFPEWHTTGDVPAVCDPASLGQVGALAHSLARSPLPGF